MTVLLRPWQPDDLPNLVALANNWNIAKYLTDKFPHPYTEADGEAFIAFNSAKNPMQRFAIEVDGEAVGAIGIHPKDDVFIKNMEIGYWIGEPFWGKGIATAAIAKIIPLTFENYDIDRIFARVFGGNIGSQSVLKKNNFVQEGFFEKTLFKDGVYLDEFIFALRRANYQK